MKEKFTEALRGKRLPILTLDNKWYRLLDEDTRKRVAGTEERLNALLRRQGKLNTEVKDIKRLKKKLMGEIMAMAGEAEQTGGAEIGKKLKQHRNLVEECNQRLEEYQDELLELPGEIGRLNFQLMLDTMECCYTTIQENTAQMEEIEEWVTGIRIELKKKLVKKQEMEQKNHLIYSYMNDVFGADVVDLFDMKYNPQEKHPVLPGKQPEEN